MTQQQASLKMGRPFLSRLALAKQPKQSDLGNVIAKIMKSSRPGRRDQAGKLRELHHHQKLTSSLYRTCLGAWRSASF
ncbi:hypothetical protein HZ326_10151 [Fusarium oxysporum f. sp. albedinis]|jgi:hypothetical protein|nr:hypothetical protein HZ326_10151 [Fusarium oxysporum f. sp. albedinis]